MNRQRPRRRDTQRTLLVLCQVYIPDPASVGQQMAGAAEEMVRRGWRVIVLTSRDGYDDPSRHYPPREIINGVEVLRLPWSSFGKRSMTIRLLGGFSFIFQAIVRGLLLGPIDVVLVSTNPPMGSLAALVIGRVRRAAIKFWVMDVNPDQLVTLGLIGPRAPLVRLFDLLNRQTLARASDVIVLDRFMARRVTDKLDVSHKISVMPPWPLDDYLEPVPHESNPFRTAHDLQNKLVVMYSGNHATGHPLSTVIAAASRLQDEPRLIFVFVGGGTAKKDVETAGLPNVLSLPYQPLAELRHSLSAADVHLVSMGDAFVGMFHPSKVYGAMSVARPILFLGPADSYIGDLLRRAPIGWAMRHGDVDGVTALFRRLLDAPRDELTSMGLRARILIRSELSKAILCRRLCEVLER